MDDPAGARTTLLPMVGNVTDAEQVAELRRIRLTLTVLVFFVAFFAISTTIGAIFIYHALSVASSAQTGLLP